MAPVKRELLEQISNLQSKLIDTQSNYIETLQEYKDVQIDHIELRQQNIRNLEEIKFLQNKLLRGYAIFGSE